MKKTLVPVLLTVVLLPLLAHSADRDHYYKILNETYNTKNYGAGITELEKAIKEHPDTADFFSSLVFFYYHAKEHRKSWQLGAAAYKKFPDDKNVRNAYRTGLMNYGWKLNDEKKYDEVFALFSDAYALDPEDQWVMNGYGHILRVKKKLDESMEILSHAAARYPENEHIRSNLAWTCWEKGDSYFKEKDNARAYELFKRAYETHSKNDLNIFTAYLYVLPRLKKFDEARAVLDEAKKRFPGESKKLYKPAYWIYHNRADHFAEMKDYDNMIPAFRQLYLFAKTDDQEWQDGRTFGHLALSNFHFRVLDLMNGICFYWQKFTPSQREKAFRYAGILKKEVPPDLRFIHLTFYGFALYRDNRIGEARAALDDAYGALMASPIGSRYRVPAIAIPFPLKGYYLAGGNASRTAVTHMGLNRYCYDIMGADEKGRMTKEGSSGKDLADYIGFGKTIYSPVDGEVLNVVGHHPDDPVSGSPGSPEGNNLQIMCDGKIFHFYHLKQNSITVKKGDRVRAGQAIAGMGNSISTFPHLHFGVYSSDWLISYPVNFTRYYRVAGNERQLIQSGRPGGDGGSELIEAK